MTPESKDALAAPSTDYPLPRPLPTRDVESQEVEVAGRRFRITIIESASDAVVEEGDAPEIEVRGPRSGRGFRLEIQHSDGDWLSAMEAKPRVQLYPTPPADAENETSPRWLAEGEDL